MEVKHCKHCGHFLYGESEIAVHRENEYSAGRQPKVWFEFCRAKLPNGKTCYCGSAEFGAE